MSDNSVLEQAARDAALRALSGYETAPDVLDFLRACGYVFKENAALTEEGRKRIEFLFHQDNRK